MIYKRGRKNVSFSPDTLEESLRFGWVDGWFKPMDGERWVVGILLGEKGVKLVKLQHSTIMEVALREEDDSRRRRKVATLCLSNLEGVSAHSNHHRFK